MSTELGRMVRFALVGVTNTLLTLACFALLTRFGVPAPVASACAFAAGAVNGYRLNRGWTFRAEAHGMATLGRYVAIQALGAAVSAMGMTLLASDLTLRHLVAEGLTLPVSTMVTYTLSRRLFSAPRPA